MCLSQAREVQLPDHRIWLSDELDVGARGLLGGVSVTASSHSQHQTHYSSD